MTEIDTSCYMPHKQAAVFPSYIPQFVSTSHKRLTLRKVITANIRHEQNGRPLAGEHKKVAGGREVFGRRVSMRLIFLTLVQAFYLCNRCDPTQMKTIAIPS